MARNTPKRTDAHRPGAIIPAHYTHTLSYYTGSEGMRAFGLNCECEIDFRTGNAAGHGSGDRCCLRKLKMSGAVFARNDFAGKCSVCGANFADGDVWKHEPTGEYIHIGNECARKYELLADRSAHELALDRLRAARAVAVERARNEEARSSFLAEHPGLGEALEVDHNIIRDIRARFIKWTAISDKQVALVLKIANEVRNPRTRQEEAKVAAPVGRVTFRGTVVSAKIYEGDFGNSLKITVKVETPKGVWLAWGTCPRNVLYQMHDRPHTANEPADVTLKGAEVEITATLKPGRDPFFALMSRPNGKVVVFPGAVEAAAGESAALATAAKVA